MGQSQPGWHAKRQPNPSIASNVPPHGYPDVKHGGGVGGGSQENKGNTRDKETLVCVRKPHKGEEGGYLMRVAHNTRHTQDTSDSTGRVICCSPFSLHSNMLLYAEENRQAKPATNILRTDMAMVGIQWASPNQAGTLNASPTRRSLPMFPIVSDRGGSGPL